MAFSVPLRGEELLNLNWGESPQTISGGLYQRFLKPMMLESAQHKKVLKKLIKKFSILLTLRIKLFTPNNKIKCHDNKCYFGKTTFMWSQIGDKIFITSKINSRERIVFELSDRDSKSYQRFSFYLENIKQHSSGPKSPFRLDFFISSCSDVSYAVVQ